MNHPPAVPPATPDRTLAPVPHRCRSGAHRAPERPPRTVPAVALALTFLGVGLTAAALLLTVLVSTVFSAFLPPSSRGIGGDPAATPSLVAPRTAPVLAVLATAGPTSEGSPVSGWGGVTLRPVPTSGATDTVTAPRSTVTAPQDTVTAPQRTVTTPQWTVTAPQSTVTLSPIPSAVAPDPSTALPPSPGATPAAAGDGTGTAATGAWWAFGAVLVVALVTVWSLAHRRTRRQGWLTRLDTATAEATWFARELIPDLAMSPTTPERVLLWNAASPRIRELEIRLARLRAEAEAGSERDRVAALAEAVGWARSGLDRALDSGQGDLADELRAASTELETALALARQVV